MTPVEGLPRNHPLRVMRRWLITGLIVLAPTAITLTVFYRLLNWVDNLLGRYLRFSFFDYHRIPGFGFIAVVLLLLIVGMLASWIGSRPLLHMWDSMLQRIPGVGLVYGSTKSLGEAFLNNKSEQPFKQVVLIEWPSPGIWRIGFITGRAPADVKQRLGDDVEVVFVPHSPNPASGFVHYVSGKELIRLDWPIEQGLKVVVSGGVAQPTARAAVVPSEASLPPGDREAAS